MADTDHASSGLPPPPPPPPGLPPAPAPQQAAARRAPKGRPRFGYVIAAVVAIRVFREATGRTAWDRWGILGILAVALAAGGVVLGWRLVQRQRARQRGGEITPAIVAKQLEDSGLLPPAYPEDGTLLGASIVVMDQLPKVLEVETAYELYGADAQPLGSVRQLGQSRWKQTVRVLTWLDQYFTHHFEVCDLDGNAVLRVTRPAKLFLSRLEVFDSRDRYIGRIKQMNVFWKIDFQLLDAVGNVVGHIRAKNVRAWDFHVEDLYGREIATIVKSWEGWARTGWTRADRYVLRMHQPLPYGARQLALVTPLIVDLALKQDARGFG